MWKYLALVALCAGMALSSFGCSDDTEEATEATAESAGDDIEAASENAAEETGEAVEEAGDDIEEATE